MGLQLVSVVWKEDASERDLQLGLRNVGLDIKNTYPEIRTYIGTVDSDQVERVETYPGVEAVEVNRDLEPYEQ